MVRVTALAYLWDPAARPWLEALPGCGAAARPLRAVTNPTGDPVAVMASFVTAAPPHDAPSSVRFVVVDEGAVTGGNVDGLVGQPYSVASFLSATATTLEVRP